MLWEGRKALAESFRRFFANEHSSPAIAREGMDREAGKIAGGGGTVDGPRFQKIPMGPPRGIKGSTAKALNGIVAEQGSTCRRHSGRQGHEVQRHPDQRLLTRLRL